MKKYHAESPLHQVDSLSCEGGCYEVYKCEDVDAAFAEMRQQHAEVVDILEKRISIMREHGAFIDRKYAEEIERLKAELGIYRESLQMREGELCVCAGTIRDLRKQAERYEKDSKRFDYWFGSRKGGFDMDGYMKGMRQGWSVDQWRAFVDSQIGVDQLPASGEEKK